MVGPSARVLDYGCGAGQLVAAALARGHDAYGCDRYQGVWSRWADAAENERVLKIESSGYVPFPDGAFDIVIANQVFEHIDDFDRPLAEIHRVLKPGGIFLNCFPTAEVWWEGHQKTPFAQHFFSSPETWRRYLIVMHWLRIGIDRAGKTASQWAHEFRHLPELCFYKRAHEVERAFASRFEILRGAEAEWIRHRLANSQSLAWLRVPRVADPILRFLCSRLAGRFFVLCRKPLKL